MALIHHTLDCAPADFPTCHDHGTESLVSDHEIPSSSSFESKSTLPTRLATPHVTVASLRDSVSRIARHFDPSQDPNTECTKIFNILPNPRVDELDHPEELRNSSSDIAVFDKSLQPPRSPATSLSIWCSWLICSALRLYKAPQGPHLPPLPCFSIRT